MASANSNTKPIRFTKACRDLTGETFGRFRVLKFAGREHKHIVWECQCSCGNIRLLTTGTLKHQQSCGCLTKEVNATRLTTHGECFTPEYRVWCEMINRCYDRNHHRYADYGGRGIYVCLQWRYSIKFFIEDMGRRPSAKHTIDRINNEGHYTPSNCRWATSKEQNRNKRSNRLITYNGETLCLSEWSERFGLKRYTIGNRLKYGWTFEQAISTPETSKLGPYQG